MNLEIGNPYVGGKNIWSIQGNIIEHSLNTHSIYDSSICIADWIRGLLSFEYQICLVSEVHFHIPDKINCYFNPTNIVFKALTQNLKSYNKFGNDFSNVISP